MASAKGISKSNIRNPIHAYNRAGCQPRTHCSASLDILAPGTFLKMISSLSRTVVLYLAGAVLLTPGFAADPARPVLERDYTQIVRPFINEYCAGCHSGRTPAAQLDLKAFTTLESVVQDFGHWNLLMERIERQEMPPKPLAQPPANRRQKVIEWVKAVRTDEIRNGQSNNDRDDRIENE